MTTLTVANRVQVAQDVVYAWLDPEFWGAKGFGCFWCHERPPIAWDVGSGIALCDVCLMRCVPGWEFEGLVVWLGRQMEAHLRAEERRAALAAWRRGNPELAEAYYLKYGVWLVGG